MKASLFRRLGAAALILALLAAAGILLVNVHVCQSAAGRLLTPESAAELEDVDCILVLGCFVEDDGTPSPMLAGRVSRGVALYRMGTAPKLLMSGDHGRVDYNEVGAMKRFAVEAGVEAADVFQDHAGFSTYDSIYRAKAVFGAERVVIVTQEYHLYRALYLAEALGLEAWGVAADGEDYPGQAVRDCRELLARAKDSLLAAVQPKPTFLGEAVSLRGDGAVTDG